MKWDLIGFIEASKYRKKIVLSLEKGNKTPKELRDELGFYITHISSTLKELIEKNIVVCLTPELRKGRIFALTDEGKKIGLYFLSKN